MSRHLIVAFAGSLLLHVLALLVLHFDFSPPPELPPLLAKLVIPPRPAPEPQTAAGPQAREAAPQPGASRFSSKPRREKPAPIPEPPPIDTEPAAPEPVKPVVAPPVEPQIPVRGAIRYKFILGTQNFEAGRAETEWEFSEGKYHFRLMAESTGLAWMVRSVKIESESRGKLVATGLQPERYSYTKKVKGKEALTEIAEFDWDRHELVLNGNRQALSEGVQDLLSVQYQFIYVPNLIEGATIGIATHRKFENHRLHVVGEEELETPNGTYRTLHVVVQTDRRKTELWLARDYGLLPFRVRHVDPNDTYELLMTEIGTPQK